MEQQFSRLDSVMKPETIAKNEARLKSLMSRVAFYFAIASIALIMTGCGEKDDPQGEEIPATMTVSETSLNFSSSGERLSFSINANVSWTVSVNASWLSLSSSSGSNNGTITVTATENSSINSRSATITISGGGKSQTINVMQSGEFSCTISFYASRNFNCGLITITLQDYGYRTLNIYYPSGAPEWCGGASTANFYGVRSGTYSYTASCSGGLNWSGTITIGTDGITCIIVKLE